MKKGFTLLELLIVIIIISILASVGFVQYGNMVERGRSAEARYILRRIRDAMEMYIVENEAYPPSVPRLDSLNIGDIPDTQCADTHYFRYVIGSTTSGLSGYTINAVRCDGSENNVGKPPDAAAAYVIIFNIDRNAATCEESATGP